MRNVALATSWNKAYICSSLVRKMFHMVLVTLNDKKPILLSTSCVITLSRTSNNSCHKNVYFSFAESEKTLPLRNISCLSAAANSWTSLTLSQNLWNTLVHRWPSAGSIRSVLMDTPPFKTNSLTVHFNPVSHYQMCRNVFWKPFRLRCGRASVFCSPLKVRYPNRAASRYITNIPRNDTFATFCIFFRERLQMES